MHQKAERSVHYVRYGTSGSVSLDCHIFSLILSTDYSFNRRNTGQTREKIDQIYLMLQKWSNSLITTPNHTTTNEKISPVMLPMSEVDEFLHRLRCLFDKSTYQEQILLMQTTPNQWGWKKIQNFFNCTSHQARAAIIQRTKYGDLSKPTDKRGNKPFDPKIAQIIEDFYLDDEISRESSNTKDTRKPKGLGTVVIRYMTMSIGETFKLFKSRYASLKVGRSKFYDLKPSWVREDCPHQVCLCIQHQNIDLLLGVSKERPMTHFINFCFHGRQ